MTHDQAILLLHVLGASVWTGGHLVLAIGFLPGALKSGDATLLRAVETRFERVGIPALIVQIATGIMLARKYLPDPSTWLAFQGKVGAHIGAKIVLLGVTLVFAIHARVRLVPHMGERLKALAFHMIVVTVLSVLFVVLGLGIRAG
ncbi:MAG: CopD family protein [Planctomycetes bacterium]|nr:CopD family protein [Planctomycetota bacterium]MCC7171679.1 CopD family protein [Planctomycetota bacterium]